MFNCLLCSRPAKLLKKPSATSSYVKCNFCFDYVVEDRIAALSKQVKNECALYSHNHVRYPGETIHFYKIARTYKECPNRILVLTSRVKAP